MPLDSRWIDAIHTRLLVRYGSRWVNLNAGNDPEMVKADWAETLDGVSASGIRHALENLPEEFPPTAGQFRKLCINKPLPMFKALPAPKANPDVARAALEKMLETKRKLLEGRP